VDRQASHFAADVPERQVDRGQYPVWQDREVHALSLTELPPDAPAHQWILADQHRPDDAPDHAFIQNVQPEKDAARPVVHLDGEQSLDGVMLVASVSVPLGVPDRPGAVVELLNGDVGDSHDNSTPSLGGQRDRGNVTVAGSVSRGTREAQEGQGL
jgi:hypothetical protein